MIDVYKAPKSESKGLGVGLGIAELATTGNPSGLITSLMPKAGGMSAIAGKIAGAGGDSPPVPDSSDVTGFQMPEMGAQFQGQDPNLGVDPQSAIKRRMMSYGG